MPKILILTMPTQSLLLPRRHIGIASSGGAIGGALVANEYDVSFLDLNITLGNIRFNDIPTDELLTIKNEENYTPFILTDDEITSLIDPTLVVQLLNGTLLKNRLVYWTDKLIDYVMSTVNLDEYDAIAYSIERRTLYASVSVSVFSFLLLFNSRLKKKTSKKVISYVGGDQALKFILDADIVPMLLEQLPEELPTRIFLGHGIYTFPEYLKDNLLKDINNEPIIFGDYMCQYSDAIGEKVMILDESDGDKHIPLIPSNHIDSVVDKTHILPHEILDNYPELKTMDFNDYGSHVILSGCKFRCSFCQYNRYQINSQPIPEIIDTFKRFEDAGIKYLQLYDTNINFDVAWVYELCNALVNSGTSIKWTDSANFRVYDRDMFKALNAAGCILLTWGVETLAPRILKLIRKYIPMEQVSEILTLAHDANILNMCNMIVNFPTETLEEHLLTYKFVKEHYDAELINGFRLIPGTEYSRDPQRFGINKLSTSKKNLRDESFNEINGRSWEQIQIDSEDRARDYTDSNDFMPHFQMYADRTLIFNLYTAFNGNISKIHNFIHYLGNIENLYDYYNPSIGNRPIGKAYWTTIAKYK